MALWRPCIICGEPCQGSYCPEHRPVSGWQRKSRPTQAERGYGPEHIKERRRLEKVVKSGGAICARCGELIEPDEPFDLDHREDRTGYLGPSHRHCNQRAAAKKGSKIAHRRRRLLEEDEFN